MDVDLDTDALIASLSGKKIMYGDVTSDGLHIWLDDGRVLVVLGVIALCDVGERTLQ